MSSGAGPSEKALAKNSREMFAETGPGRHEVLAQLLQALQTGGAGARLPIIAAMQEQSAGGMNQALDRYRGEMARRGLGDSSIAAGQEFALESEGLQKTRQIAPEVTMQFIQSILPLLFGQAQTAMGGMGQAAGVESQRDAAMMQAIASMMPQTSVGYSMER